MCGNILCVAAVLLGIDAGWQPLPEGGVVYLIQLEPQILDRLASGEISAVESDLPPYVKDIRTYRITVGTDELPRELPPATSIPQAFDQDPAAKPIEVQPAAYVAPPNNAPSPSPPPSASPPPSDSPSDGQEFSQEEETPGKPWLPLTLISLALFASLGGNFFLGWITWDIRIRYRALLLGR